MQTTIQNFNLLPRSSLEKLGVRLRLRMSLPELLFCARQYQGPANGEITEEALRFLDALACPAHTTLAKIAISELSTEQAEVSDAFSCAIADVKALGKDPEKPYTLADFAALALRGTRPTAPLVQRAAYGDALVLLRAPANTDASLAQHARCVCDCATESPVHAALRICNGAIWELARLPAHVQGALALTECCEAQLLALPQEGLDARLEQAKVQGADACVIGVVTNHGTMEIRQDKQIMLSFPAAYLRKLCFIRAYKLQDLQPSLYTSALHKATEAYVQAVAEGCDPACPALCAQLSVCAQPLTEQSVAELLSMILGIYRFSGAVQVPVEICADLEAQDTGVTIRATTQSKSALPRTLQGQSRTYLLAPHNLQELRAMSAYLHKAMQEGKIKSARAICNQTPKEALADDACDVIFNPHAAHAIAQNYQYALLVESNLELCGDLIGVSTQPKQ